MTAVTFGAYRYAGIDIRVDICSAVSSDLPGQAFHGGISVVVIVWATVLPVHAIDTGMVFMVTLVVPAMPAIAMQAMWIGGARECLMMTLLLLLMTLMMLVVTRSSRRRRRCDCSCGYSGDLSGSRLRAKKGCVIARLIDMRSAGVTHIHCATRSAYAYSIDVVDTCRCGSMPGKRRICANSACMRSAFVIAAVPVGTANGTGTGTGAGTSPGAIVGTADCVFVDAMSGS